MPPGFLPVFGLSGGNLQNALTQLSGEANVDGQAVTFQQMTQFLSLMLDPFVAGRNGVGGGAGALGFAPEQETDFPSDIALAYDAILKAPPKPATLDQRWTAWGTAYGGSDKTNGDPAVGSNTFTANTYGFAAGMDYHPAPDAILGFALAGGGTSWSLAQALGSGRSDAFQAGVYGTKYFGPAYVSGALALRQQLDDHEPYRAGRPAHRKLQRAELWRPRRSRLSLCGAAGDRRRALRRPAGADGAHADL